MTDSTFGAMCVHCGTIGHAAICHRGDGVTTVNDRGEGGHYTKWVLAATQPTSLSAELLNRYDNAAGLTVEMPDDLRSAWKQWATGDGDKSDVGDGAAVEQDSDLGSPVAPEPDVPVEDF